MNGIILFSHRETGIEVLINNGKIYFLQHCDGYYLNDTPEARAYIRVEVKIKIKNYYEEKINKAFE